MQPGGHRFDPGQLHQISVQRFSLDVNHTWVNMMESILSLGGLLVPIVAIIVGGAIAIVTLILKHQERIAKIERGIDPDAPVR